MLRLSYPRRQQYRRLRRAAASGAAGVATGALALVAATADALSVAGILAVTMVGLLLDGRRWVRLAGRSRVGARSENEVRRALAPLEAEGWRLRHSLRYRGRGDVDSVAIAPTGIAFAIETKTRSFDARHLAGVREIAAWLHRRRPRWCRRGAVRSSASCAPGAWSAWRTGSWSSRSTASRRPSERQLEPHGRRAFLTADAATRT